MTEGIGAIVTETPTPVSSEKNDGGLFGGFFRSDDSIDSVLYDDIFDFSQTRQVTESMNVPILEFMKTYKKQNGNDEVYKLLSDLKSYIITGNNYGSFNDHNIKIYNNSNDNIFDPYKLIQGLQIYGPSFLFDEFEQNTNNNLDFHSMTLSEILNGSSIISKIFIDELEKIYNETSALPCGVFATMPNPSLVITSYV